MTSLAVTVDARLKAAGFGPHDPALIELRAWNQAAADRGEIHVEVRRGQFGQTRKVKLSEAA